MCYNLRRYPCGHKSVDTSEYCRKPYCTEVLNYSQLDNCPPCEKYAMNRDSRGRNYTSLEYDADIREQERRVNAAREKSSRESRDRDVAVGLQTMDYNSISDSRAAGPPRGGGDRFGGHNRGNTQVTGYTLTPGRNNAGHVQPYNYRGTGPSPFNASGSHYSSGGMIHSNYQSRGGTQYSEERHYHHERHRSGGLPPLQRPALPPPRRPSPLPAPRRPPTPPRRSGSGHHRHHRGRRDYSSSSSSSDDSDGYAHSAGAHSRGRGRSSSRNRHKGRLPSRHRSRHRSRVRDGNKVTHEEVIETFHRHPPQGHGGQGGHTHYHRHRSRQRSTHRAPKAPTPVRGRSTSKTRNEKGRKRSKSVSFRLPGENSGRHRR